MDLARHVHPSMETHLSWCEATPSPWLLTKGLSAADFFTPISPTECLCSLLLSLLTALLSLNKSAFLTTCNVFIYFLIPSCLAAFAIRIVIWMHCGATHFAFARTATSLQAPLFHANLLSVYFFHFYLCYFRYWIISAIVWRCLRQYSQETKQRRWG